MYGIFSVYFFDILNTSWWGIPAIRYMKNSKHNLWLDFQNVVLYLFDIDVDFNINIGISECQKQCAERPK